MLPYAMVVSIVWIVHLLAREARVCLQRSAGEAAG